MLVAGDLRWRSNFSVGGVPVEVFHNPARQVRALFAAGDAATITMFAQGRIVLPHSELDALVAEARALYAAGPAPRLLTHQARHALIDEVMDARALASGNDPRHVLVAVGAAHRAVGELYATRGWWKVKREHWLRDLGEREPGAAQELLEILTAPDAGVRQAALEALTPRVTGEREYRDGASEPQPVE